jgi:hypothetical protein
MEWKMNPNAVNQFSKGAVIYAEGEPVFSVAMVIKGRVLIHNNGAKVIVGSGSFLGINDLYTGRFLSTYTAYDDLVLYVFAVNSTEEMDQILSVNKDYHGFLVASFYKMIFELEQIYQNFVKNTSGLYQFLTETYNEYLSVAARRGYKVKTSERISNLRIPEMDIDLLRDKINYYIECRYLPIDVVKAFYSYGNNITLFQVEDQVDIVNQLMDILKELAKSFIAMANCLADDTDTCLFQLVAEFALEMDVNSNEMMDVLDNIIEEINKAEIFTERMLGQQYTVNRKRLEEVYNVLITGNHEKDISNETVLKYSKEDTDRALEELNNSFQKLLNYAGIANARAEEMNQCLTDYIHLKDKTSSEDHARLLRRHLTDHHYELYKIIFLKAVKEKNPSRLINLFLTYGYVDERLLTKEQLLSLYFLKEEEQGQHQCKVYNIKEWLTLIYEGKKEPSKNEFDLEYTEMLNELKKQSKLTEKEAQEWMINPERKLEYEIQNMFRYNNRTTNGQITSFVPVLHKEQWSNHLERLQLTASKVNEALNNLLKIDYSVFDRELLYVNKEKKIEKEYVVRRIYPDIILMPNVGSNGVMWQEIAGKRRDTPGRFLLPIFTDNNLTALLTRILGRYRWELCRTMEGSAWNDIKHKSLTSEYSDYLQFYRKNKELSEEKKDKLKAQIQKGRNNSREVFVIDYEQWINYEAIGALKLNKPVREMMATYCPFAKHIREQIKLQPIFEEAMARYYREKQKKIKEVEGRHRLLQKDSIELTPELINTLEYYKEL